MAKKAFRSDTKAVSPKDNGRIFETLWQPTPSQLSLFSSTTIFPMEGKDGLAVWGQAGNRKMFS
jgi:hypothetical protein